MTRFCAAAFCALLLAACGKQGESDAGQARAGSIRSPIWVGGGRAFAARPRDFTQKVNRKMYRAAMQSMVSQLVREDRLFAVESLQGGWPPDGL